VTSRGVDGEDDDGLPGGQVRPQVPAGDEGQRVLLLPGAGPGRPAGAVLLQQGAPEGLRPAAAAPRRAGGALGLRRR